MLTFLKKFTVYSLQFTVFSFLLLVTLIAPVFAQTTPVPEPLQPVAYSLPPTIPPTSPLYTDLFVNNMFHTFSCLMVGSSVIGQPCLTYQVTKNAQGVVSSVPVLSQTNLSGGLLGGTTSLIAALYAEPPIRTSAYFAYLGQNLGFAKQAYAQNVGGAGENVLHPILTLWQISRNISYVIMIIIFVIIGLMVMFRQRINPQTVITAQAAIPGLVLGLILITFSYFLASLISDTAFVGTNVVGAYFAQVRGDPQPQNLIQEMSDKKENVLTIVSRYVGIINKDNAADIVGSIWDNLDGWVQFTLRTVATAIAAQFVLPFGSLGGGVWQLVAVGVSSFVTNATPGGTVGFILALMAVIILVYAMIRLLLRLISSYLTIIFLTITAPFQFLIAALPGRQGIGTNWILNMLGNALVFPAVLAVIYFVAFILGKGSGPIRISDAGTIINSGLIPIASADNPTAVNIIGNAAFPLFGGMSLDFVRILLAFGALVALPGIPDLIVKTVGKVGQAGQLLGQEFSQGVAGGRGYYNQVAGTGPGFAQNIGNLRDQPLRHMMPDPKDPSGKRMIWVEEMKTISGVGSPTMGTWSRISNSYLGQKIGGGFNKILRR